VHPPGPIDAADAADLSVVVELHVVPPVAAAVLTGDLDLHSQLALDAVLRAARELAVTHLTLDVRDVDFVSLDALAAVAATSTALAERGGRVTLHGARPVHHRVLAVLGASRIELTE
jgi:anti-anti-sigma factor